MLLFCLMGCSQTTTSKTVPQQDTWGIYALTLSSNDIELIYSSSDLLDCLQISKGGDKFVFTQAEEIYTIDIDGNNPTRLTTNSTLDTYASFNSTDTKITFLSWRAGSTLDLYTMNLDGTNQQLLYDSGGHDADPDWVGECESPFWRL